MSTSVYPAERSVFGDKFESADVGMGMREATELIERYVTGWTVKRTRGGLHAGSWCYSTRKEIHLSRDAGLPVVLHELAHALTPDDRGHGLAFQKAYIDLVAKEMSPWWARRLRASFIRHRTKGHKSL